MSKDTDLDDRLRRYLLDQLDEPQRSGIEEEYFADDHAFEHLLVVENELLDAFAADALPPAERESFQRAFLANPARRERVPFARSLRKASARAGIGRVPEAKGTLGSWWSVFAGWRLAPSGPQWAAAAAMIVVLAGVGWLALERARLQDAILGLQVETDRLARNTRETQTQLQQERRRTEALIEETRRRTLAGADSAPPPSAGNPGAVIATFLLAPRLVRGGPDANTITVAPGSALVRLNLELEEDSHPRYAPRLTTIAGDEVWSQRAVQARATGTGPVVSLEIPASLLSGSDYILTLSARASGQLEEVASYSFRVVRKAPAPQD